MSKKHCFLTSQEVGDLAGLTANRINQLVRGGVLTKTEEGHDCRDVIRELVGYYRNLTDTAALKREKLQKEIEILAQGVAKGNNEVLNRAEAEGRWVDIVLRIRDKFRRIGAKISPRLPFCKSELEMQKIIETEVDEILTELARADFIGAEQQPTAPPIAP